MPGATTASEVSFAAAMDVKLDMMPRTVPNKPRNRETEAVTARLARPPPMPPTMERPLRFIVCRGGCDIGLHGAFVRAGNARQHRVAHGAADPPRAAAGW